MSGQVREAPNLATPLRSSELESRVLERHWTVAEVAEAWQLSRDAVRRLFQNEPGVFALRDTNPRRRKRPYVTLRIPQSVLERVHRQYSLVNSHL